jgi:hypothetical protein
VKKYEKHIMGGGLHQSPSTPIYFSEEIKAAQSAHPREKVWR